MKPCTRCGVTKPLDSFHRTRTTRDGRRGDCKECAAAYAKARYPLVKDRKRESARAWAAANRERNRETQRRAYHSNREENLFRAFCRRYGLSEEEGRYWMGLRDTGCPVCGSTDDPNLDHCHDTGVVRGWLCGGCNRGIGQLGDDPARLRAAAAYLEQFVKEARAA